MRTSTSAAVLVWLLGMAACGDDDGAGYGTVVGAPCRSEIDCAPGSRCERGGDFPDGTCTLPCRDHLDCPPAAACIEKDDGICLVLCRNEFDCRPGYKCKVLHDEDQDGDSMVCIK